MTDELTAAANVLLGTQIMLKPSEIVVDTEANPRRIFDREALNSLAMSIKAHGVLQPVVVYKDLTDGKYHLIAGERRIRAAKAVKLATVPAILKLIRKDTDDDGDIAEMRFSENEECEALTPLEVANSIRQILGLKITHNDKRVVATVNIIAEKNAKSPGWVRQHLSILDFPQAIQDALAAGTLAFSHVRVLSGLKSDEEKLKVFRTIMKDGAPNIAKVQRAVEHHRAEQVAAGIDIKTQGRPIGGGGESEVPDVRKQGLETALERLQHAPVNLRKKSEVREAIATAYERCERARSEDKKIFTKGVIAAFEWIAGFRETY